jgi:hypothetical protein
MEQLSNNSKARLTTFQNAGLITNINDVPAKRTQIYNHIKTNYTNKNTIKNYLIALGLILRALNKNLDASQRYLNEAVNLKELVNLDYEKQEFTEEQKQNFIPYIALLKIKDYWKKIYNKNNTIKNNYLLLLISLYTLQPPLRKNDYMNMKILNNIPPNDDSNYLHKKRNNKYTLIIQNDKVSEYKPRGEINIENGELIDIINTSLRNHPRPFLLSSLVDVNKHMLANTFVRLINEIFVPFGEMRPGINLLRVAYITHFEKVGPRSLKERNELAEKMRHSIQMQQLVYNKHNENVPVTTRYAPKEYAARYYESHRDEVLEKRKEHYDENTKRLLKKKMLYYLRQRLVDKPQERSIRTYNLRKVNGVWR